MLCCLESCPPLDAPENGSIIVIGCTQKYVIFRCDPGYALKGVPTAECINGEWIPKDPSPECV